MVRVPTTNYPASKCPDNKWYCDIMLNESGPGKRLALVLAARKLLKLHVLVDIKALLAPSYGGRPSHSSFNCNHGEKGRETRFEQ